MTQSGFQPIIIDGPNRNKRIRLNSTSGFEVVKSPRINVTNYFVDYDPLSPFVPVFEQVHYYIHTVRLGAIVIHIASVKPSVSDESVIKAIFTKQAREAMQLEAPVR